MYVYDTNDIYIAYSRHLALSSIALLGIWDITYLPVFQGLEPHTSGTKPA